jgi:MFS family permease
MPDSRDRAASVRPGADDGPARAPLASVLADGAFVRIWLAGGMVGTVRWLETLAVGIYAYQATESPLIVAGMLFARMLPTMLLGAIVGAIAERAGRRRLLLAGLAFMCTVSATLAVLVMTRRVELWHIGIGAVLGGAFISGEFPVRRTMLGEVAGLRRIGAAMGLDSATNNATRMLGPLLGGALLASLGLDGVYALSVVLYTFAFLCIATLKFEEKLALDSESAGLLHSLREGLAYIRTNRLITGTLLVTIVVNLFGFAYISMVPVIGEHDLELSAAAIGVLMSAEGLGALLGSLGVAIWARARHFTTIYLLGSIFFLCMILGFSFSSYFAVAFCLLFAAGLGLACFGAMQSTIVFSASAPRMRTRVMGVLVVCIGAGPIGVLHLGLMAEWLGAQQALTVMAVEGLIAIAISALLWPELRRAVALPDEHRD